MRVQEIADAAAQDPASADVEMLLSLGLAYQVTGNAQYCTAATSILQRTAVSTNTLSGDSYYDYRFTLPWVSAGFDWCYAQLSPSLRAQVARWLMDRADDVWPETNAARIGGWGVGSPANNYYWGFMMTWPAALAAYGDDTGTHPVSGTNRPAYHLTLALTKWTSEIRPYLDGWGRGGVFAESTNYDAVARLGHALDAHLTATGENLASVPGCTFVQDSLSWRIHSTVPTNDLYYPLGDQPRISIAPLSPYDRERALSVLPLVTDTRLHGQIKYWLDHIDPNTSTWTDVAPWEFLYYEDNVAAVDYTTDTPTAYLAPGPGLLVARSNWTSSATYFGIWSGPLQESHQSRDVNGFLIYKGGWLIGNANIWSHSGIEADTRYQNNLTFGANDQSWQIPDASWPQEAGRVLNVESGTDYTYFAGTAAQAYVADRAHEGVAVVTDAVRKFLYIASADTFIVYDRFATVDPALPRQWRLQSERAPVINGRQYTIANAAYKVFGTTVLANSGATSQAVPLALGASGATSSYSLQLNVPATSNPDYLLNVLQIGPASTGTRLATAALRDTSGVMDGVQIGTSVALFGRRESIATTVEYRTASASAHHYIADLRPSYAYEVTVRNDAGTILRTLSASTTAEGVLSLTIADAGARLFTLVPLRAGSPPAAPKNLRVIR